MNKIVKEHYPISKLPEDLRPDLPLDGWVRVQVETETAEVLDAPDLAKLAGSGRNVHGNELEVIDHIRSMREDR
ncbi:MAG: hypothetical protein U1E87_04895 [Alphaproteobacteria bacterium]